MITKEGGDKSGGRGRGCVGWMLRKEVRWERKSVELWQGRSMQSTKEVKRREEKRDTSQRTSTKAAKACLYMGRGKKHWKLK